ncbi:ISAs1 family transposase [Streptomyces virginiae]
MRQHHPQPTRTPHTPRLPHPTQTRPLPETDLTPTRKAHYAFTVKRNQPNLYAQLRALPWREARAKFYDRSRGHGWLDTRVVQTLTVTDLGTGFPYAAQVARIVRHRVDTRTGKRSRETVYVITDLTSPQASPERIAKTVRAQWVIENRLHFVRDTAFREDASKIRTGHGPENMATLRSFAINALRAVGHNNMAAGLREMSLRPFERPLDLLELT